MAKIFSGTYATTQTLTSVAENPATIQTTGRLTAGLVGSTKDNLLTHFPQPPVSGTYSEHPVW